MANDRFVYWEERKPTREQIKLALEDYIGDAGKVFFDTDRFYCVLVGKPSSALRRAVPEHTWCRGFYDERWFEVYFHEDVIDIITRHADEFTSSVAEGFVALCARVWEGRREE